MNPGDKKSMLFKKSRPNVRKFILMDGEAFSRDTALLWAAYQAGSFKMEPGLSQEDFVKQVMVTAEQFETLYVVDDANKNFKGGLGPVVLVGAKQAGLIVEPQFMFFKWATCRNVLRCTVAFLNMVKSSTKTGILLVRATDEKRSVAEHMKKYGLLFFMGKSGDDEYLYSVRGLGSAGK